MLYNPFDLSMPMQRAARAGNKTLHMQPWAIQPGYVETVSWDRGKEGLCGRWVAPRWAMDWEDAHTLTPAEKRYLRETLCPWQPEQRFLLGEQFFLIKRITAARLRETGGGGVLDYGVTPEGCGFEYLESDKKDDILYKNSLLIQAFYRLWDETHTDPLLKSCNNPWVWAINFEKETTTREQSYLQVPDSHRHQLWHSLQGENAATSQNPKRANAG